MSERFLNHTAVVTGAGAGLGRATAERLLVEGAKVVLFGRNRERLEQVAERAPARTVVVEGDVTIHEDRMRLAQTAARRFGGVDVLVTAAGAARFANFAETTIDEFRDIFEVNFYGVSETIRALLPHFNRPAAIVIPAGLPNRTIPGLAAFSASKAAVQSLAETLAVELAPRKIRVNSITPGPIETGQWRDCGLAPEARRRIAGVATESENASFAEPDDAAEAILFLASDAASGITGREIIVAGV